MNNMQKASVHVSYGVKGVISAYLSFRLVVIKTVITYIKIICIKNHTS